MSEPILRSPLHDFELSKRAKPIDSSHGVWANEVVPRGYIGLRGNADDEAFLAAASRALGNSLPVAPCAFEIGRSAIVLWLSPDEWMIVCPRSDLKALLEGLRRELTGIKSQVTDNSGGYTEVILRGANATDLLTNVSVYDLEALGSGRVVGTTFGKTAIYLRRDQNGYVLLLRRSFADYIWRYLVRAAEPYGLGIAELAPGDHLTSAKAAGDAG